MSTASILNIILSVLIALSGFVGYYFYIKSEITKAAEQAIGDAEVPDKTGEEKLETAVDQVCAIIPALAKPFLSREVVRRMVQSAFDKIEDYARKQVEKKCK